jgi:hypothetical protein
LSPHFKFLGWALMVVIFAAAWVKGARAEEREPGELNATCLIALANDTERIKAMHAKAVPYDMVRHLVLTDPTNRDEARWVLMRIVDGLYSGQLAPERAITFLWGLCSLSTIGGEPSKDDAERQPMGMFWPLQDELKDI